MGKLDKLMQAAGSNIDESMGASGGEPITAPATSVTPARWQGVTKAKNVAEIPVSKIVRDPGQPREEFDAETLERLAESIRRRGVLQPIRARWDEGQGAYVVIAGERRWRAATMAGLVTIPCVVDDRLLEPTELLAVQLIENALREDLRPVEAARAYRRLMEANGWSARQVAQELDLDHSTVVKALALLELPVTVQEQIETGRIAPSVGYELSKLEGASVQAEVAQAVVAEGLKRAEVADLVRAVKAKRPAPAQRPDPVTFDLGDGCTVTVRWRKSGGPDLIQALRRVLKLAQEQRRTDEAA